MDGFVTDSKGVSSIIKDPNAVLDYKLDWTSWLALDTLLTVTWSVPQDLVKTTQANDQYTSTIWLSGGRAGTSYTVECRVTTLGGRTEERSFKVICQDR
jgi:hypothetical protein